MMWIGREKKEIHVNECGHLQAPKKCFFFRGQFEQYKKAALGGVNEVEENDTQISWMKSNCYPRHRILSSLCVIFGVSYSEWMNTRIPRRRWGKNANIRSMISSNENLDQTFSPFLGNCDLLLLICCHVNEPSWRIQCNADFFKLENVLLEKLCIIRHASGSNSVNDLRSHACIYNNDTEIHQKQQNKNIKCKQAWSS